MARQILDKYYFVFLSVLCKYFLFNSIQENLQSFLEQFLMTLNNFNSIMLKTLHDKFSDCLMKVWRGLRSNWGVHQQDSPCSWVVSSSPPAFASSSWASGYGESCRTGVFSLHYCQSWFKLFWFIKYQFT